MSRKVIYTKSRGETVASLARPVNIAKLHVILGESKWSVVIEGNTKALRTFLTVDQAINFAKDIAAKKTGEVVIHEENGLIKDRISFNR